MSISQASGGKVWNIPVEVEDIPAPMTPVKQGRFSRLSFDDSSIIAIIGTAVLFAVFTPIFWNLPLNLSFISPIESTINTSESGYTLQNSAKSLPMLLIFTISTLLVMLLIAIMTMYFLYKKSIVSTQKVFAVLAIPVIVALLCSAFIAAIGKSASSNISIKDWVKERYSISLPESVNTTDGAFKDGVYFRNPDNKDILELKEADGRIYLYNLNGEEVKPTVSKGK